MNLIFKCSFDNFFWNTITLTNYFKKNIDFLFFNYIKWIFVKNIFINIKSSLFVSVGGKGTIITSSNGTKWTRRTSGTKVKLRAVTYGNDTLIAVGFSGIQAQPGVSSSRPEKARAAFQRARPWFRFSVGCDDQHDDPDQHPEGTRLWGGGCLAPWLPHPGRDADKRSRGD